MSRLSINQRMEILYAFIQCDRNANQTARTLNDKNDCRKKIWPTTVLNVIRKFRETGIEVRSTKQPNDKQELAIDHLKYNFAITNAAKKYRISQQPMWPHTSAPVKHPGCLLLCSILHVVFLGYFTDFSKVFNFFLITGYSATKHSIKFNEETQNIYGIKNPLDQETDALTLRQPRYSVHCY